MPGFSSWDEMVAAFRAAGGVADNVTQRDGPLGRGLFPIDPALPVTVHAPPRLLVPESALELRDGALRARPDAGVPEPARAFFDAYQAFCSWGGGGRLEVLAFLDCVRSLPRPVASALSRELHLGFLFEAPGEDAIRERFVKSRCVSIGDTNYAMPMVELANHDCDGVSYDTRHGAAISGRFDGEVLVRYDFADTCLRFIHYGFAAPERFAFCVPMSVDHGGVTVTARQDYHANRVQNDILLPLVSLNGSELVLSHLLLGDRKRPQAPRHVFRHVMRRFADEAAADALLDRIAMVNRMLFLRILAACEEAEGGMVPVIRRMCRLQLEALSCCLLSPAKGASGAARPG